MADVTWGVKVSEEFKEQINRLMKESGLQGRDFMQQVISSYMLELAKTETPEMAQDLRELQSLTQRINDIYLNIGHRVENLYADERRKIDSELAKRDGTISELHGQLGDSREKYESIVKLYNERNESISGLRQDIEGLTEHNESLKALNREYRDKISTMEGEILNLNSSVEDIEVLKGEKMELEESNQALQRELAELKTRAEGLEVELRAREERHREHIEAMRETFAMEKTKLALDIEKGHMDRIREMGREHRQDVKLLENRQEEIKHSYDRRINELMDMYRELSMKVLITDREEETDEKGK